MAATGKVITSVSEATPKDVDKAVDAAQKAYDTKWGLNTPGAERSILLAKLAKLLEKHADELAALETLNNGASSACIRSGTIERSRLLQGRHSTGLGMLMSSQPSIAYATTPAGQIRSLVRCKRLVLTGITFSRTRVLTTGLYSQTSEAKLTYTRHEPIGVVGQIIPWNFPC